MIDISFTCFQRVCSLRLLPGRIYMLPPVCPGHHNLHQILSTGPHLLNSNPRNLFLDVYTKMGDHENFIHNRKLTLCHSTKNRSISELLHDCPDCNDFVLYCCVCNNNRLQNCPDRQSIKPCHHYHVIFTGGACTNNGRRAAKAGVGAAHGKDDSSQRSLPITDEIDNFPLRSNNRAELCAAKPSLELIAHGELRGDAETMVIATDSEYVVKGMTEWLPTWRVRISQCDRDFWRKLLTELVEEWLAHV